jgi:hypothetical protein
MLEIFIYNCMIPLKLSKFFNRGGLFLVFLTDCICGHDNIPGVGHKEQLICR